jgi:hypothetical protein
MFFLTVAFADIAPPPDLPTPQEFTNLCAAQKAACIERGEADEACAKPCSIQLSTPPAPLPLDKKAKGGCSSSGAPTLAAGTVLGALVLLGVGRRGTRRVGVD